MGGAARANRYERIRRAFEDVLLGRAEEIAGCRVGDAFVVEALAVTSDEEKVVVTIQLAPASGVGDRIEHEIDLGFSDMDADDDIVGRMEEYGVARDEAFRRLEEEDAYSNPCVLVFPRRRLSIAAWPTYVDRVREALATHAGLDAGAFESVRFNDQYPGKGPHAFAYFVHRKRAEIVEVVSRALHAAGVEYREIYLH